MFVTESISELLKTFFEETSGMLMREEFIFVHSLIPHMFLKIRTKEDLKWQKTMLRFWYATVWLEKSNLCCSLVNQRLHAALKAHKSANGLQFFGKMVDNKANLEEMAQRFRLTIEVPEQKHSSFGQQLFCTHLSGWNDKVSMKFLLANTTFVLQPCDQGIITALKAHFRNQLQQIIINFIFSLH